MFPRQITRWELWLITRESWDFGYNSSHTVCIFWIVSSQATQTVYLEAPRLTSACSHWSTHASFRISQQRRETQKQKSLSDDLQRNKRRLAALNQSLFCEYPHPTKREDDWKASDNTKDQLRTWIFMPLATKLVSLAQKSTFAKHSNFWTHFWYQPHQHSATQRPQRPHKSPALRGKSSSSTGCIHRELLQRM